MTRPLRLGLTWLSFVLIAAPIAYMLALYVHGRGLDAGFSGTYEDYVVFHSLFWYAFHASEVIAIAGCVLLGATITSNKALRAGLWTLAAGVGLLFCTFAFPFVFGGLHDWSGAVIFSMSLAVFCAGAVLGLLGGIRVGWSKWREHRESLL